MNEFFNLLAKIIVVLIIVLFIGMFIGVVIGGVSLLLGFDFYPIFITSTRCSAGLLFLAFVFASDE